jgi:hypothetical protein
MRVTIIDNDATRREGFCDHLHQVATDLPGGLTVEDFEFVWGSGPRKDSDSFVPPGDVVFIHANDIGSPGWATYLRKRCQDSFVVCYSGDGVGGLGWSNNRHFAYQASIIDTHDVESKWKVSAFLNAIADGQPNPFNKLTGHDASLEIKLRLLHSCLTPEGKSLATDLYNQHFPPALGDCQNDPSTTNSVDASDLTLANSFRHIISLMDSGEDCLSRTYIEALKELKKALHLVSIQ